MAQKQYKKSIIDENKRDVPGKVPPHSADAEQALLGAILLSDKVFDKVSTMLEADDFYEPRHKKIFSAVRELSVKGDAVDQLTLSDALRVKGLLEEVGGASYLGGLSDLMPTAAHAEEYAKIVRGKAILRNLIDLSTGVVEASFREEYTHEAILEEAEQILFKIRQREQIGSIRKVKDMVSEVYEKMKMMGKQEGSIIGLETGFSKIDDLTSGLQKQNLVIIAARPSLGKTSLAMNIAYKLAVEKAKNVLVFSLEMSAHDLVMRFVATGSKVDLQKIRRGKFITKQEESHIMHVLGKLSESSIFIDTDDNSVLDMRSKSRNLMAELKRDKKEGIDLIIVDYMQLIRPNDNIPREQQISQISRSLKALARELDVPVVALSQLNREAEKRETPIRGKGGMTQGGGGPKLSDLRESGAIEQDADIVIFIAREGKDEGTSTYTDPVSGTSVQKKAFKCKFIIAKNRNGPTGEQLVWFVPDLTQFESMSGQSSDEDFSRADNETI
jgi:replicative DNA helicase